MTDFRVDNAKISEHDFWFKLPGEARKLIFAYATSLRAKDGVITFEMATYRWPEIEAAMGEPKLTGPKR